MNAAPSPIALFDFLDRTHAAIKAQLQRMRTLVGAIETGDLDMHTREQARKLVHQGLFTPFSKRERGEHSANPGAGRRPDWLSGLGVQRRVALFSPRSLRVAA